MSARDCIKRIQDAAGRALTDDEVGALFERIHKAALDIKAGRVKGNEVGLGKKLEASLGGDLLGGDPDTAKNATLLVQEAAQKAAMDMRAEADLVEKRAALQLVKMESRFNAYQTLRKTGLAPLDAVRALIARDYSGRTNVASLEQVERGYKDYYGAKVLKTWEALGSDFFGFFQNREKLLDLVRELRGEDTGNALAKKGAQAFHETAEEARQVFNANGGQVGQLDNWGMPQHHSQEKVARAGGFAKDPAQARDTWINDILPLLDRERYVDDAGVKWGDAELKEFLKHAWNTIATNGNSNVEAGKPRGNGGRANRHAEERQIHFKDAESYIQYWNDYGDKTALEILMGHIDTMARDIAFVEHLGPNPNTTYQTLRDTALTEATIALPAKTTDLEGQAVKLDNLFNYASGKVIPTANMTVRKVADGISNLNVAGKLGGAMFASLFGDKPVMEAVSHLNHLPALQRWRSELALLNPTNAADRAQLKRQGLMLEGVRSGLQRFYEGLGSSSWTGRVANAVMRITGMQAINDIRKGAFGLSLMNAIGNEVRKGGAFDSLHDSDVRTLRNYGIEPEDWATWQLAKLEDYGRGNDSMLTPEAISKIPDQALVEAGLVKEGETPADARRHAIVKLLGAVNTESDFAIVTPGYTERAQFYADLQRGTVKGEIARSVLQFKAFPWTQFQRGMDLVANQDKPVSKAIMASYLIAATTLAGAMLLETRDMLSGKDPRKINGADWWKFWGASFISGGALGIYGDFLYGANQNRYGSGILETMAGPTMGPLSSMLLVNPMNALKNRIEGKETHLGAQTIQSAKGFVPANNVWYTKAALDHLVWQRLMEWASPGYLGNIRSKTLQEYGQDWWWEPGKVAPDRPPEMGKVLQ